MLETCMNVLSSIHCTYSSDNFCYRLPPGTYNVHYSYYSFPTIESVLLLSSWAPANLP